MIRLRLIPAAALALALPFAAAAQSNEPQLVDQGVTDLDSLATSLKVLEPDMRAPFDFERLYAVPGRSDLLMRQSGGITAVFPESRYAATRDGVQMLIPPGTVFHIGGLNRDLLPGAEDFGAGAGRPNASNLAQARASLRLGAGPSLALTGRDTSSRRVGARVRDGAEERAPEGPDAAAGETGPTVWTDELYRRERMAAILAAARAEERRRGSR